MVFPFEYEQHGSADEERAYLRRLIYKESLLFRRQNAPREEVVEEPPRLVRQRSLTTGSVPRDKGDIGAAQEESEWRTEEW